MATDGLPVPERKGSHLELALRIFATLAITFAFLTSVKIIGTSFKMANQSFTDGLMARASNPLIGVFVGLLVTSLLQSSSATTSMLVGFVAAGTMPVETAIPIVMGANIGTTVTNTLVAMGHVTRPTEFRRAIACSTMHDFFNIMSVIILLPIEATTGFLSRSAGFLANQFDNVTQFSSPFNPLKVAMKPIVEFVKSLCIQLPGQWSAVAMALTGGIILFVSLWLLTKVLKSLMLGKVEGVLGKYLDRHGPVGILIGAGTTAAVQSSSVTTSFFVPLSAAGLLKPRQIYPMVLGANLGTTITALLAALGGGNVAGLTLAFTHLLFNICGLLIFYPIPKLRLPILLSERFSLIAVRWRALAIGYILVAFYAIPLTLIFLLG